MQPFHEPALAFSVAIPDHWRFLPPAWSPTELMKRALGPGELIALANKPFCCGMAHHDSNRHAYPTLQATVRAYARPDNPQAEALLEQQLATLAHQWPDLRVLRSSTQAIVSGHRANLIHARFTMHIQPEDQPVAIGVLSRSYTVFALGRAYTLGLSGSDDAAYYDEQDFDAILSSVRIGAGSANAGGAGPVPAR
jgi:hypothetical protein